MNRRVFNQQIMLWMVGLGLGGHLGCQRSLRGKKSSVPNILLCIADDMSFEHTSAYGCSWIKTPGFDTVAKNGILFINAYTPNAKCAPSRACLLTGRNPWQLEAAANHYCYFPKRFKTFPEALVEHGYGVGYTGKGWAPGEPGLDASGKPRQLCGTSYHQRFLTPPTSQISNIDYAANFETFLNDLKPDQPFFFWYGGLEPHREYEYGSGKRVGKKEVESIDRVYRFWPDNPVVRTDMLDYGLEVEWFDRHLRQMLEILEKKGELENTLVIVTSDNGMPFPRIKGQCYIHSHRIPLAIMWKNRIKPGRVIEDFVSFIDFAPTFLEICGIAPCASGMEKITGKSLVNLLFLDKSGYISKDRDFVLIGRERNDVGRPDDQGYPIRGIITKDYLYLKNFASDRWPAGNPETGYTDCDGSPTKTVCLDAFDNPSMRHYWQRSFGKRPSEELYFLPNDPDCLFNLAFEETFQEIKKELSERLTTQLKIQEDPRVLGQGDIFDTYPFASPEHRNYYQRRQSGETISSPWINPSDLRVAHSKQE